MNITKDELLELAKEHAKRSLNLWPKKDKSFAYKMAIADFLAGWNAAMEHMENDKPDFQLFPQSNNPR